MTAPTVSKSPARLTFWSLADLAETAEEVYADPKYAAASWWAEDAREGSEWRDGPDQCGLAGALERARFGWSDVLPDALALIDSAVSTVEQDLPQIAFRSEYAVAGCEPDVGRYLGGEPECMVDFPLIETPRTGRVVTLCSSGSYSGSVSAEVMRQRGMVIAALALELSRLGLASELWLDFTTTKGRNGPTGSTRVLVKGANDVLDPALIVYAFAHPSVLRRLLFAAACKLPNIKALGGAHWPSSNQPGPPKHDLPDGTIYLPEVCTANNIPDAADQLRDLLRQVGLID